MKYTSATLYGLFSLFLSLQAMNKEDKFKDVAKYILLQKKKKPKKLISNSTIRNSLELHAQAQYPPEINKPPLVNEENKN